MNKSDVTTDYYLKKYAEDNQIDPNKQEVSSAYKAFKDGSVAGAYSTLEVSAAESLYAKYGLTPEVGEKTLSLKETKDLFGLELKKPVTGRQAAILADMKEKREEALAEMGKHLSFDTPLNAISTFAGMATTVSMNPSNVALSALISALATPAAGVAVGVGRAAKKAWNIVALAKTANTVAKVAKKTQVLNTSLVTGTKVAYEGVAKAFKMKGVKSAGLAGTANAVEELAIHAVEAGKGFHYDRTSAVAFGFFAPAVLHGAMHATKGLFKLGGKAIDSFKPDGTPQPVKSDLSTTIKLSQDEAKVRRFKDDLEWRQKFDGEDAVVKKHLDDVNKILDDIDKKRAKGQDVDVKFIKDKVKDVEQSGIKKPIGEEILERAIFERRAKVRDVLPFTKNNNNAVRHYDKFKDIMDEPTWSDRLKKFDETHLKDSDNVTYHKQIRNTLRTMKKLERLFGVKDLDTQITTISKDMIKSGFKPNVTRLFPFLTDPKSLERWMKLKQDSLPAKYGADFKPNKEFWKDEVFNVTQKDFVEFYDENIKAVETAPKRDADIEKKPPSSEEAKTKILEAAEGSDDPIMSTVAKAEKEIDAALKGFKECLLDEAGGLTAPDVAAITTTVAGTGAAIYSMWKSLAHNPKLEIINMDVPDKGDRQGSSVKSLASPESRQRYADYIKKAHKQALHSLVNFKNKGKTTDIKTSGYNSEVWESAYKSKYAKQVMDGTNMTVAVVDTGVTPDDRLNEQIVFDEGMKNYPVKHFHGQHVTGIIDQIADLTRLFSFDFYSDKKGGNYFTSVSGVVRAMKQALASGADIVNMSLSGSRAFHKERNLVIEADKKGIILVVSAGNTGADLTKIPEYPASYDTDSMIVVSNMNQMGMRAESSSYGAPVDATAPGTAIKSYFKGNRMGLGTGTSQAAPMVTGALVRVRTLYPQATPKDVIQMVNNFAGTRYKTANVFEKFIEHLDNESYKKFGDVKDALSVVDFLKSGEMTANEKEEAKKAKEKREQKKESSWDALAEVSRKYPKMSIQDVSDITNSFDHSKVKPGDNKAFIKHIYDEAEKKFGEKPQSAGTDIQQKLEEIYAKLQPIKQKLIKGGKLTPEDTKLLKQLMKDNDKLAKQVERQPQSEDTIIIIKAPKHADKEMKQAINTYNDLVNQIMQKLKKGYKFSPEAVKRLEKLQEDNATMDRKDEAQKPIKQVDKVHPARITKMKKQKTKEELAQPLKPNPHVPDSTWNKLLEKYPQMTVGDKQDLTDRYRATGQGFLNDDLYDKFLYDETQKKFGFGKLETEKELAKIKQKGIDGKYTALLNTNLKITDKVEQIMKSSSKGKDDKIKSVLDLYSGYDKLMKVLEKTKGKKFTKEKINTIMTSGK